MSGSHEDRPRSLGYHAQSAREVFLLTLDSLTAPYESIAGSRFTCFCAIDANGLHVNEIGSFCASLLQSGCAYLSVWGPDCQRVHDIMDEEVVGDNPPLTEWGDVMTTWHENESLEEALEFFVFDTYPDDTYAPNGCDRAFLFSIGSDDWSRAIERRVTEWIHNPAR